MNSDPQTRNLIARKDALLSYRKGPGLTLDKLVQTPDRIELFGHDDPIDARRVIVASIKSEPKELTLLALANALAIDSDDPMVNLMERRAAMIREYSMAMRSLTTYEERGAMVAAYILPHFFEA